MHTAQPPAIDLIYRIVQEIFSDAHDFSIERVMEGVSTFVYRICRDTEILYLRILPEADASFAPEALVHQRLRASGVHAPDVLYVASCHAQLGRSLMVTTAVPGRAIGEDASPDELQQILFEAGKELAQINSIPVTGYGWIRRDLDPVNRLVAEHATYQAWIAEEVGEPLQVLARMQVLSQDEIQAIEMHMEEATILFSNEQAVLAHGDFDGTHIYHQAGQYTGMIDFGEIRGANRLYDLGHFQAENSELLPYLLAGYANAEMLPRDYRLHINLSSLFIATHRLGRRLTRRPGEIYTPALETVRRMLQALA